ncbi:hypothetical protein CRE_08423 [Caenorhabditis remanei]|uniref:Uncharacterized protein n=1 Tax=Caenorhabditis remanei TaxID=31234 RepID=E3MPN3_CAERE|nr:hypothetical protein CRE_08423 [Caenorhabditis remanei]
MIGYTDRGVPDTKYVVTKELTLEDAAWRTILPPQSCIDTNSVSVLTSKPKILNFFQPIGFIFKEKKVLCMKCRRKFEYPTTEKKMINDCHARKAWS